MSDEPEMVKRVAMAMWEVRRRSAKDIGADLEEWGDGSVPRDCGVMDEACAAIEAMRVPTDAMVAVYDDLEGWDNDPDYPTAQDAWKAMISTALHGDRV